MTTKKENVTAFAGIDDRDEFSELARWYRNVIDAHRGKSHEFPSLQGVCKSLPRGEKKRVAYYDDEREEWVEMERHSAVVNPEWVGDGLEKPDAPNDAAWNVPTQSYAIVNPMDAVGPLLVALNKAREDMGNVFGKVERYRNGGEIHVEMLMDGITVGSPDAEERPYVAGICFGWSHYGDKRLYMEPVIYDTRDNAAYRDLADPRKRRHVKPAGDGAENTARTDVVEWWEEGIAQLETVADTLFQVIADARAYDIPFPSLPFDAEEYYSRLGLPSSYAEDAADRIPTGEREPDAFTAYHAMCQTLTDEFDGKPDTLKRHTKAANEILHSPPKTVADVLEQKEMELRNAAQSTLTSAGDEEADAADAMLDTRMDIEGAMDAYRGNRDRLRTLLTEADTATTDTPDDGGDGESDDADGPDADESDEDAEAKTVMTDGGRDLPDGVGGYCTDCEHLVRTNTVSAGGVGAVCDHCGGTDSFLPVSAAPDDAPIQPNIRNAGDSQ